MLNQNKSFLLILFLMLFFSASCSKKPPPAVTWSYQPKGLTISLEADKKLNSYKSQSHTVMLVIYQLENITAFKRFSGYEAGILKLLEGELFDPAVVAVKKVFVEPGESRSLTMDRAENAKWVGIVAGYFGLAPNSVTKTFQFTSSTKKRGFIRKTKTAEVDPLEINLLLAPSEIREVTDK